jgi:hypothetical protein
MDAPPFRADAPLLAVKPKIETGFRIPETG